MHRLIRDHLEEVLADSGSMPPAVDRLVVDHLEGCRECRAEVAQMRRQATLLREMRPSEAAEPRAGFYARVMERIEAQGPVSIWSLFFESTFGRRIAVAAMALALLLGVYMVSSEQAADQTSAMTPAAQLLPGEDGPGQVLAPTGGPDQDAVLVNLVTYQEQ